MIGVHTVMSFVLYYTVDIGPEKNEMLTVSRGFVEPTFPYIEMVNRSSKNMSGSNGDMATTLFETINSV